MVNLAAEEEDILMPNTYENEGPIGEVGPPGEKVFQLKKSLNGFLLINIFSHEGLKR